MIVPITAGVLVVILAVLWFATLSRLLGLRGQVTESLGVLACQLMQRHDLIPDVLTAAREGVRKEMHFLKAILDLTRELNAPAGPPDLSDVPAEFRHLAGHRPPAVPPGFKTDAALLYVELQRAMVSTEKDVTAARRFVESAIGQYNAGVLGFPARLVASAHGLAPLPHARLTDELKVKPDYFGRRA